MNLTQDIETLWETLRHRLTFDGMSLAELEELSSSVDSVLGHLTDIEALKGELLSRSAFWPKDKALYGDEVYVLGLNTANEAGQKAFLENLRNELIAVVYTAQNASSSEVPNE